MPDYIPYDPGVLPSKHAPKAGEGFELTIERLPPRKNRSRSIRNTTHPFYDRFVRLRASAVRAMDGRAPYRGIVGLELTMFCKELHRWDVLNEFMGGVMDTLDGSHGPTFTYLPIVYEDDCQVSMGNVAIQPSREEYYILKVTFKHERERFGEQDGTSNGG
jgi:hypothetical protein